MSDHHHDRALFLLIDDLESQLVELSGECAENRRRIHRLEDDRRARKESGVIERATDEVKTVHKRMV